MLWTAVLGCITRSKPLDWFYNQSGRGRKLILIFHILCIFFSLFFTQSKNMVEISKTLSKMREIFLNKSYVILISHIINHTYRNITNKHQNSLQSLKWYANIIWYSFFYRKGSQTNTLPSTNSNLQLTYLKENISTCHRIMQESKHTHFNS